MDVDCRSFNKERKLGRYTHAFSCESENSHVLIALAIRAAPQPSELLTHQISQSG